MSKFLSVVVMLVLSGAAFGQESPLYSPDYPVIEQSMCIEREVPHYYKMQETVRTLGDPVRVTNTYFSRDHENLTACDVVAKRIPEKESIGKQVVAGIEYPSQLITRKYQCLPVRLCAFDQHE